MKTAFIATIVVLALATAGLYGLAPQAEVAQVETPPQTQLVYYTN